MGLITPSSGRTVSGGTTATTGRNTKQSKWVGWANTGIAKSVKVSDWAAPYVNGMSNKFGAERFWPASGDYADEIQKCTRILKGFSQQGFVREEEQVAAPDDPEGKDVEEEQTLGPDGQVLSPDQAAQIDPGQTRRQKITRRIKKVKIIRKIPPEVLKKACGIAIYTSMRSGMAPFGGSGGSGLVMSRLPDGSWSGPSFITPQNASAGLMFGLDVYDVVLLIMSPEALQGFKTHKFTLGAETGVAAGPVGTGASMDLSVNGVDWTKSSADVPEGEKRKMAKPPPPLFSYTRNRGFYGGIEGMAMIYLTRFDENERVYHWPGITGRDVLEGRVHKPPEAKVLYEALAAAESGQAQDTMSDLRVTQHADKTTIAKASSSEEKSSPVSLTREFIMDDGERLELPLTPEKLEEMELQGVKNSRDDERMQADYKAYIWSLPAPPRHPAARTRADGIERTKGGRRFVAPASSRPAPNSSPATEPHKDDAEARDQPQEQVESPSELRTPLSLQGDFKEPPDAGPLPSSSTTTTPLPPPPPYTSDSAAETAPRDTKQALYPEKIPHGTSPPEGSQVGEPQFGPPPSSPQALHRQDLPTATPHQGSCSEGTFTLPEQNFERQATPFPDDKDVRDMKDDKNEKEKDQKDEQDGEDNEGEGEFFDLPLNGMEKVPGHPVPSQDQKAYLPQETGVLA